MHEWTARVVPLFRDAEALWMTLSGKCRNRIRKGLKNGLEVSDCDDPAFPEEHYRQLLDVYADQGLSPPVPLAFYQSMFRHLKPSGLFTVLIKHQGRPIASGFFPHDDRWVYSVSTSSYSRYQNLSPNELMHWTVRNLFTTTGIPQMREMGLRRSLKKGSRFFLGI